MRQVSEFEREDLLEKIKVQSKLLTPTMFSPLQ
jgi:hypothetical protein